MKKQNTTDNILNIKISDTIETDVLILGAGTAGVFAAIDAAKCGAKVIIVDKNGIPGGTMTTCGVNFPGLFYAWGKQIIAGSAYESILRANNYGGATMPQIVEKPEQHWHMQVPLDTFVYANVLDEMLEQVGVWNMYHSMICDIQEKTDGIEAVVVEKNKNILVKAKVFVDASGDANGIARLGLRLNKSEVLQPATLINSIDGYDLAEVSESEIKDVFDTALSKGEILKSDLQGKNIIHLLKEKRIYCHIHTHNPETSQGKSDLEKQARKVVFRVLKLLRTIHGLEGLYVKNFAIECGVRESLRIDAITNISAEDYINGKIYKDAVCYAFYPIDLHTDHSIKQQFHKEGMVSTVPYSALIPKNSKYVLVAGRCIGADTDANSALRVEATCMATGSAAGCAAALMSKNGYISTQVPYHELCAKLKQTGAIVPQQ